MSTRSSLGNAVRALARTPAFSVAAVLTLTVGLGAAAAIFGVVNAVLLRPLPYPQSERLVNLVNDVPSLSATHIQQTVGMYLAYHRYAHTLDASALYQPGSANAGDPDGRSDPVRLNVAWTTASLFPLLGVAPLRGRAFTEAEDVPHGPSVVVISERLWKTRFGSDPNVTSRKLVVGGRLTDVVGVMPSAFRFPSGDVDLWLPLQVDPLEPSGGFSYNAVGRLAPGATAERASRELAQLLPRAAEITPSLAPGVPMKTVLEQAKPIPRVLPLRDDMVGGAARALWVVAGAALLVLLVTCANATNLYLVRADARRRELAVRAALGASRGRVLAHFLAESIVLSGVAAVLGLGFAGVMLHYLALHGPSQLPRIDEIRLDGAVVLFITILTAVVAVVCSAVPALRVLASDPLAGLRESTRGGSLGGRRQRTRGVLVAAQVALAVVVLAASALLARSYRLLHAVRPGFDPHGVTELWVALPQSRYPDDTSVARFSARLGDVVRAVPGVDAASVSSHLPFVDRGTNMDPVYVEGDARNASRIPPLAMFVSIDSGYFGTLRIPLIAGRNFDRLERQHADEAIITREVARQFFHDSTGRGALNKRFQQLPNGPWHTVVGVVDDIRDTSLAGGPMRAVYLPQVPGDLGQLTRTFAIAARTRRDEDAVTRSIIAAMHELDPTLPAFLVQPMDATLAASTAQLSFTIVMLGVAAAVTLVLGMIGLYGVIAYVVALRTRELGLRIALGAQPRAVARMITGQGLALAATGAVVGLLLVVGAARFMRALLFGVSPSDPLSLVGAAVVLLACAALACWVPARRAERLDPMAALRTE